MPMFSENELRSRAEKFKATMREKKLDCAIAFSFHNSYYLSGVPISPWGRWVATVLPLKGDAAFVTPSLDIERVEEHSWIKDIRAYHDVYPDSQDPLAWTITLVKGILEEKGLDKGRIGTEEHWISFSAYERLKKALPDVEFVNISEEMERQRMVLTKEEISLFRKAGKVAVLGMDALVGALAEGRSELDLQWEASLAMQKEVTTKYPELEYTGSCDCKIGIGTILPHAYAVGEAKLRKNDIIEVVTAPTMNAYFPTLERTVFFGKPTDKQKKIFEAMIKAREEGIAMFRPGTKFSDIWKACFKMVEKAGYRDFVRHSFGHCHGIMYRHGYPPDSGGRPESGEIKPYNHNQMREGMITSMLLGIYVPNMGGFRHGDMFLITKDGGENLTPYEQRIIV